MFDLIARLSLRDNFSPAARRAMSSMGSMTSSLAKTAAATTALTAGLAATAAAVGSMKLVSESLKGASMIEQNTVAIQHFAGLTMGAEKAEEATKSYMDYLTKNSALTPFSNEDVMNAGRRLINVTSGDMDGAKKLLTISEDMAALNPGKSLMDAVEALADMKTGEFERMKEFGFKISARDLEKAGGGTKGAMKIMMNDVAKTFEGGSDKLAKTALGSWSTITGTVSSGISQMGVKSLDMLKPELEKIARFLSSGSADKLFDAGSRMMARMFEGIINSAKRGWSLVQTRYLNNPDFLKIRDIPGKVTFIIDDLLALFNAWYDSKGAKMIEDSTKKMTDSMASFLANNASKFVEPGLQVGASIARGMIDGLKDTLKDHPVLSGLAAGLATPGGPQAKLVVATAVAGQGYSDRAREAFDKSGIPEFAGRFTDKMTTVPGMSQLNNAWEKVLKAPEAIFGNDGLSNVNAGLESLFGLRKPDGSHSGGLSRVPYDNYRANLHEGETILRKSEADEYRSGRGGSGANVTVTGNTFHVRQESDIDAIAKALAEQAWGSRHSRAT